MRTLEAIWHSPEPDPDDIYGRSLEDITIWADVDDVGCVMYGYTFRRDQTHYEDTNQSVIKLYEEFVFNYPDYRKAVLELFDEVLNNAVEEASQA
jgi:hypothetical protein